MMASSSTGERDRRLPTLLGRDVVRGGTSMPIMLIRTVASRNEAKPFVLSFSDGFNGGSVGPISSGRSSLVAKAVVSPDRWGEIRRCLLDTRAWVQLL